MTSAHASCPYLRTDFSTARPFIVNTRIKGVEIERHVVLL